MVRQGAGGVFDAEAIVAWAKARAARGASLRIADVLADPDPAERAMAMAVRRHFAGWRDLLAAAGIAPSGRGRVAPPVPEPAEVLASGAELNWQEMNGKNLDAAETWALLFLLADSGAVEEIYIDRELQKLLHDYALSKELLSKAALAKWMEYPRPTGTAAFIQHVPGHTDHLHVRFSCAQGQSRCKSR